MLLLTQHEKSEMKDTTGILSLLRSNSRTCSVEGRRVMDDDKVIHYKASDTETEEYHGYEEVDDRVYLFNAQTSTRRVYADSLKYITVVVVRTR